MREEKKAGVEVPKIPFYPQRIVTPIEEEKIEEKIEEVKEKMRHLEKAYLKREISEAEYRRKRYEYTEQLHLLERKRKKKKQISTTKKPIIKKEKPVMEKEKIVEKVMPIVKEKVIVKEIPRMEIVREREPEKIVVRREEERKKPQIEDEELRRALAEFDKEFTAKPRIKGSEGEEYFKKSLKESFHLPKVEEVKVPEKEKTSVEREIEKKALSIGLNHAKFGDREKKVGTLMKKYNIPEKEMESEIKKLNTEKLLGDFDKLISLIEIEHRAKGLEKEAPKPFEKTFIGYKKKKEAKTILKEIEKHKIITDFDKILNYVNEKGSVKMGELKKELNMDSKRLKECCNILEKNNLIKVEYPPVGDVRVISMNYDLIKAIKKIKKKKEKK